MCVLALILGKMATITVASPTKAILRLKARDLSACDGQCLEGGRSYAWWGVSVFTILSILITIMAEGG